MWKCFRGKIFENFALSTKVSTDLKSSMSNELRTICSSCWHVACLSFGVKRSAIKDRRNFLSSSQVGVLQQQHQRPLTQPERHQHQHPTVTRSTLSSTEPKKQWEIEKITFIFLIFYTNDTFSNAQHVHFFTPYLDLVLPGCKCGSDDALSRGRTPGPEGLDPDERGCDIQTWGSDTHRPLSPRPLQGIYCFTLYLFHWNYFSCNNIVIFTLIQYFVIFQIA